MRGYVLVEVNVEGLTFSVGIRVSLRVNILLKELSCISIILAHWKIKLTLHDFLVNVTATMTLAACLINSHLITLHSIMRLIVRIDKVVAHVRHQILVRVINIQVSVKWAQIVLCLQLRTIILMVFT